MEEIIDEQKSKEDHKFCPEYDDGRSGKAYELFHVPLHPRIDSQKNKRQSHNIRQRSTHVEYEVKLRQGYRHEPTRDFNSKFLLESLLETVPCDCNYSRKC